VHHLLLHIASCQLAVQHRLGCPAAGKESRLKGFEFPKSVHLDPTPFSIDADLITPKMSLKRPQLLKHYKKQVRWTAQTHFLIRYCRQLASKPLRMQTAAPQWNEPVGWGLR
jgi:hypothetical protein